MVFYPNSCITCQATGKLKRCNRCQMVSYCGSAHQKEHFPQHQEICKVIARIMSEKKVSHVYEKLRDLDWDTWNLEREDIYSTVQLELGRNFSHEELKMFQLPRVCFVCHDARQHLLKNCPDCPFAAFCKRHPSSSAHNKDCSDIRFVQRLDKKMPVLTLATVWAVVTACPIIIEGTPYSDRTSKKLPKSMSEFLYEYARPEGDLRKEVLLMITSYLSVPLTLFSAIKKMDNKTGSQLLVHVASGTPDEYRTFEILLHMIPKLNHLVVIMVSKISLQIERTDLCGKCIARGKVLLVKSAGVEYEDYVKHKEFRQPNFAMFLNLQASSNPKSGVIWKGMVNVWLSLKCPLIITSTREPMAKRMSANLKSVFPSRICYDGFNEFCCLRPELDWEDFGIDKDNQFMVIVKGEKSKKGGTFPSKLGDEKMWRGSRKSTIDDEKEKSNLVHCSFGRYHTSNTVTICFADTVRISCFYWMSKILVTSSSRLIARLLDFVICGDDVIAGITIAQDDISTKHPGADLVAAFDGASGPEVLCRDSGSADRSRAF
ncbi:uncharacterized protein LOC117179702 [Belonocnema kinseyi]|uniref:uncharacterized protein LOC117179702 n=1 Tax=Belonocnema kinseyi TaxID=2817044 RepID=UPI00143DCC1B|nr:uncharacterized protein LOC117179702 [Belonocnema kinseyi]